MPNKFSVYAGKDKTYPAYSGKMAYVRLNGGDGSFRPNDYEKEPNDIFGYGMSS